MSSPFIELQRQLKPTLRAGDIEQCEHVVSEALAALPESPFHKVLDLHMATPLPAVASFFDAFVQQSGESFGAIYTEMNGFDINPDFWFCSVFGYESYGGLESFDWLSDWQFEFASCLTIAGLEDLQAVYASDAFIDDRYDEACEMTSLLVAVKFQRLIQRAATMMSSVACPILATAHGFDFIADFRPGGYQASGANRDQPFSV